jgi:hypothetical protein
MVSNRRSLNVFLAVLLLAASTAGGPLGCASWKKEPARPEALLAREEPPRRMRLTLADGSAVEMRHPESRGDSLFGSMKRTIRHDGGWDETRNVAGGVALADIRFVELRKADAGKTLLLVAAGVGATVIIAAIAGHEDKPPPYTPPPPPSSGGSGDGCFFCSCPLIYSYDGRAWALDSGTFGGAFLQPLGYTDFDLLEALAPRDGALRLRLQAGDKETDHIDDFAVLAVDHDPSVAVATDPDGGIHTVVAPAPPISARDSRGRDALPWVRASDGRSWESALAVRDTAVANDVRETLTLEFARPSRPGAARLVLRANKTAWAGHLMRAFVAAHGTATSRWYDAMDAEPSRAAAFRRTLEEEVHLSVSVWEDGRWTRQGSVWGGGPEIQKTHAIPIDLSRTTGDVVRVRLESAPSFWLVDWAALDTAPERPFEVREAATRSAIAGDGRDAAPMLRARDGVDLVLETGDAVEMTLDEPPLAPGRARTYLSRTTGWYRFHAPETGPPDTALLDKIAREPRGISKMSIVWMNDALRALASVASVN